MELDEIVTLLKENDFTYIDLEEGIEVLDDYYTVGQLLYNIEQPIDMKVLFEALQGMGLIRFYEGHQIPNSPDYTAFAITQDEDDNDKLLILYRPSILDELGTLLNENEFFLKYMEEENQKQYNLFKESKKHVSIAIDTTGGSMKQNKIIAISLIEFDQDIQRKHVIWVDNNWDDVDIKRYTTPKIEGKKSAYDYLQIPLPGMPNAEYDKFISITQVLRVIYSYVKDACVVIESKATIEFITALYEKAGINPDHHINQTMSGYVELSRIAKVQKKEYMKMKDILSAYNVNTSSNYYAYGNAFRAAMAAKAMLSIPDNQ